MCGIFGLYDFKRVPDQAKVKKLTGLLAHRGPDSDGFYFEGPIALGHRRLSIIDLETGQQPFTSSDGRYTIVFNGEIYNYLELRSELESKGVQFRTSSDTEVLLKYFILEGASSLDRLNGMFALAIWDNLKRKLFCARDRLGIKPFYFTTDSNRFCFASELTPLLKSGFSEERISLTSISDYLSYWYVCEPKTVIEDIHTLPPGHFAWIDEKEMSISRYWEIPKSEASRLNYGEALEQLEYLLKDAIKMQIRSDVPYGTFLSGGIDSGLVTAIARQQSGISLKSFGIGFEEDSYNELNDAKKTAGKCGVEFLEEVLARPGPDDVRKIMESFDEPLGNASFVPTFLLARHAKKHVKVVLTGDGGDEVFGGYPTYQAPYYLSFYDRIPNFIKKPAEWAVSHLPVSHGRISLDYRLKQFTKGASLRRQEAHISWRQVASLNMQKNIFNKESWRELNNYNPFSVSEQHFSEARSLDLKNQFMYVDLNTFLLSDHLRKVDRMTMAHGLEARVPLLDHRIVELGMQMPSSFKVDFFTTKKILKDISKKYLPPEIIKAKKKGLTSPIAHWVSGSLENFMNETLSGGFISELFKPQEIGLLMKEHKSKATDHSRLLWGLVSLQIWHEKSFKSLPSD